MKRIKELLKKHREVISYLFFGVMTTLVSYAVFFGLQFFGDAVLGITSDTSSPDYSAGTYYALITVAQVLQWVAGVLFAFFTNRKWVFEDTGEAVLPQLLKFSAGRVATFGLDSLVTFGTIAILQSTGYSGPTLVLMGISLTLTAEIIAKVLAAIVVIIANYIISKIFVFKNKTVTDDPDGSDNSDTSDDSDKGDKK